MIRFVCVNSADMRFKKKLSNAVNHMASKLLCNFHVGKSDTNDVSASLAMNLYCTSLVELYKKDNIYEICAILIKGRESMVNNEPHVSADDKFAT